jgi:hypothetical protein
MGYRTEILGWMTEHELKTLEQLAKQVPVNGNILEIGSMFGRSAVCWAMSADPSVTISCIDWFLNDMVQNHSIAKEFCVEQSFPLPGVMYDVEHAFIQNTKEFTNIKRFKGSSPHDLGGYVPEMIDLFFLDAAHINPSDWDNLTYFLPHVNTSGIICGHDYSDDCPHVKENVLRLEGIIGTKAIVYPGTLIWSIKK